MADVQAVSHVVDPSITSTASEADPAATPRAASPRKRRRSLSHSPISETRALLVPTHSKALLSATPSPRSITGASAITDVQHRKRLAANLQTSAPVSPNSAREALDHLVAASKTQMSKPTDDPGVAKQYSRRTPERAPAVIQTSVRNDRLGSVQVSPKTTTAQPVAERLPIEAMTSNGDTTASPGHIDDGFVDDEASPVDRSRQQSRSDALTDTEGHNHKALTFPGPMTGHPHRTASLPQAGYGRENSTSSNKRHKCPYCDTDFTRHHNLKSHLLTHSQEKPFSCDRCDSRFRRLHDLKRHAKLHTGERPHVCPKCDRSFARGDALARHNKGQGGCAGRRESVGSFAGDDRHDDSMRASDGDGMAGILYTNEASHEPEHMNEDADVTMERGLPKIQKHDAPPNNMHQSMNDSHILNARQPSTYPPVAARPTGAGLYPPPAMTSPRGGSGTSTVKHTINHYPPPPLGAAGFQQPSSNMFAQSTPMTESPKPLSPGSGSTHQLGHGDGTLSQHRSPSLTQVPPQSQFRRTTGNNGSSPVSLPPPSQGVNNPNPPHLPPLHGLTQTESRYGLLGQQTGPSPLHTSTSSQVSGGSAGPIFTSGNAPSAENSTSSHGTAHRGSLDRGNPYGPSNERLWALVENLANKVQRLEEEVASLKAPNGAQQTMR